MMYRTSISYQNNSYNNSMCHSKIVESYQYLQLNHNDLLKEFDHVTIRTNGFNIWVNFVNCLYHLDYVIPKEIPFNIYVNDKYIRGLEYVDEEFELDNSHIIKQKQHPHTFFQSDNNTRVFIYNYVYKHYSHLNKIVLLGGEFYLYSQLFIKPNIINCFTDNEDLYNDAIIHNNSESVNFNLIDYNNYDKLTFDTAVEAVDIIIIQVSPNGLKPNILQQVAKMKATHIIYIGCKEDIVDRDIKFLGYQKNFYKNFDNRVFLTDLQSYDNNNDESKVLISLGSDCVVAYQLQKHGFRLDAFPFDWIKSSLDDIIQLIRNNFNEFIDKDQLIYKRSTDNFKFVVDNNEDNVQVTCGHIYGHKKYKSIQFCHDFIDDVKSNIEQVEEKYKRRIERFQQTIYNKSCVFIRYETGKIKDEVLLKWDELVKIPLVIISKDPKIYKSKYITFVNDTSIFDGWARNNFQWANTFTTII
jgi:hypothetical protein